MPKRTGVCSRQQTMPTICIIEHPEQLLALRRRLSARMADIVFYCASLEAEPLFGSYKIQFIPLNDDALKNKWDAINTWARKTSFEWFDAPPFRDILRVAGVNMGDAISRPISYALVYALKVQLLVNCVLNAGESEKAIVFEDFLSKNGKRSRMNRSLNCELARQSRARNIPCETIRVELNGVNPIRFGTVVKDMARSVLTLFLGLFQLPLNSIPYVGLGAIDHILPVMSQLRRSDPVMFVEDAFHFNTWRLCRHKKIVYRVTGVFLKMGDRIAAQLSAMRLRWVFRRLTKTIKLDDFFCFQGQPVPALAEVLTDILFENFIPRFLQVKACERMVVQTELRTLILHEDVNALRAAALTAKRMGKLAVVLSHGIPPTKGDWRGMSDNIGIAETIVNSDFERDKYLQTGYVPNKVHALGLPRFDRIFNRVRRARPRDPVGAVLYCPHMLRDLAKHQMGYLGIHTPGTLTERYAITVMTACKNATRPLWVKLHDDQDVERWKKLCIQHGGSNVTLFQHHKDIFSLLEKSSLLITTFSTVIIEAMLFDLNVIAINFTGDKDIHPYAEYGIVLPVSIPEKLEGAIRDCFQDPRVAEQLRVKRREWAAYFCGPFDGQCSRRSSEWIRSHSIPGLMSRSVASANIQNEEVIQ